MASERSIGDCSLSYAHTEKFGLETPAMIIDVKQILSRALRIRSFAFKAAGKFLFSTKALHFGGAITELASQTDGYSVSSLFEARLVRDLAGSESLLSCVSPILRNSEVAELDQICNRIILNSPSSLRTYAGRISSNCDIGMRLNPKLSFIEDDRYDPCRRNSKLGVHLERFCSDLRAEPNQFAKVSGIHFHSNCDSEDSSQLIATIRHIESALGDDLRRFRWFNVGGGYDFTDESNTESVSAEFHRLTEQYGVEMVIEPGAALVRSAGSIVSTVEDIVEGDDYPIAILDTTVNHWPEVFEYQFEPDVEGHVVDGPYTYLLAGCSCLAGDLFGEYSFNDPLEVGSRVTFLNAGAYSIVKAHMFNGINLPDIYIQKESGELELVKRFTYEDFALRNGVDTSAIVGT